MKKSNAYSKNLLLSTIIVILYNECIKNNFYIVCDTRIITQLHNVAERRGIFTIINCL